MRMQQNSPASMGSALGAAGDLSGRFVMDAVSSFALSKLAAGSIFSGRREELRGRSVLIATTSQLAAAAALIELDGLASRMVLYPPDMPLEHLSFVMDAAQVGVIVTDRNSLETHCPTYLISGSVAIKPEKPSAPNQVTEWILLTSGTTGQPKLVAHTLASLAGAIDIQRSATVWSTFYDIRRYGGIQIFLRALLAGRSLILSNAQESTADFLRRAGAAGVTHISGTPSHWRRALMSPSASLIAPSYVRVSGEVADQALLNQLRGVYPEALVTHAFATTEAGVAFVVTDGLAGFPASVIEQTPDVEMRVVDFSLRIRSNRTASRYLGNQAPVLKDDEGFVDTGDMIELREDRYYFVGRRDGVINVGGQKVYPEEVEAVLNRHPEVQMSLVRRKKNPITGALVVAEVVLKATSVNCDLQELQQEIVKFCRETLAAHKVPAAILFVPALAVSDSGKMVRRNA